MENEILKDKTLAKDQNETFESQKIDIKFMETWLSFCKNLNNKGIEETKSVLRNIIELHEDLINRGGIFGKESSESQGESESEKYFLSTFAPEVIKNLLNNLSKDRTVRDLQRNLFQIYLKIFAENLQNQRIFSIFKAVGEIFDHDKNFFKSPDGKDASEVFLERIYPTLNPNYSEWRLNLKIGDHVDYLLKDTINEMKTTTLCCSWTRGEIIYIDENSLNMSVRLNGTGGVINDISMFSNNILPVGTLSHDYEWRQNLKEGDEIDFLDLKSWYLSTVLDTVENPGIKNEKVTKSYKNIKYGLRVYRPNGRLTDKASRKYFGWSEEYDKYITVHDPKVRKPHEFSKSIHNYHMISSYPIEGRKFNETETYVPFQFIDKKFYVVPKKIDNKNVDVEYFELINKFCFEYDGLNQMSLALENYLKHPRTEKNENTNSKENLRDIFYFDLLNLFVEIIYYIHNFVHIKFFNSYFKNFLSLSFEVFKKFSNIETSNFKRDRLESCLRKIKDIMGRIYIETDVNFIFDTFVVEFGLNLFKFSRILQKRLLGIKLLSDILNEVLKNTSTFSNSEKHYIVPYLTAKVLYSDSEGKDIFDYIYDTQTHSEILQKSPELLKAFFTGRFITATNLSKLLHIANSTSDTEIKTVINKGIIENVDQLSCDLQIFLIKNLMEKQIQKLSKKDIEIIIITFKSLPVYEKDMNPKICEFFSNLILVNYSKLNLNVNEYVIAEWISLMKSYNMREYIIQFVCSILKSFKDDKNFLFIRGLKIMTRLIESVFNVLENEQKEALNLVLLDNPTEHLDQGSYLYEKEENIIGITLNFLKNYHTCAKAALISDTHNTNKQIKDIDNFIFTLTDRLNSAPHKELINTIMDFIALFLSIKNFSFSNHQIEILFKFLVEDPISPRDCHIFFKWLKEAEDKNAIPKDSFQAIFVKMIENDNLHLSNISLDLFDCLWNIFLAINKKMKNLEITEYKIDTTYGVSNTGATLLSRSYNPEKKGEFEIRCLLENPDDLLGLELIWKLVISCLQTSEVSKKSNQYFLKIFFNNDFNSEKRGNFWKKVLERAIKTIGIIKKLHSENKINKIEKRIKIVNCLNIIKTLVEETEKKGTAGCISHNSILKHLIINLKITNSISGKISNLKSDSEDGKILNFKVYANTTIWDLKKLIAKRLAIIPESIKIVTSITREITVMDHGKTLGELNFKTNESITITKNPILDQIPKVSLIHNGELSEKAVKAFSEIFETFSTNGFMSKEQSTQFIYVAIDSNETILVDDSRVKGLFDAYDFDKDNKIDLRGFLKFYRDSIIEQKKANTVWENLRCFNYRNDLKKLNEPLDDYNSDISTMPRYFLSKNNEYFNTIFELQDEDEAIATEASKLLSIISTNPTIFKEILFISRETSNWETLIDAGNSYKLLYSLQIIESFFEEFEMGNVNVDNEPYESKILESDLEISQEGNADMGNLKINRKVKWIENFLSQGGINHIIKIILLSQNHHNLEMKSNKTNYKISSAFKACLNLSLKILRTSLSILFRARNKQNSKDKAIIFLRKESLSLEKCLINDEKDEAAIEKLFDNKCEEQSLPMNSDLENQNNLPTKHAEVDFEQKENLIEAELIENINLKYGDTILKNINFQLIAHHLMSIAFEIGSKSDSDQNMRSLFNHSINLLSLIIVSQDNISNFLESGIFKYRSIHELGEVDFKNFILNNLLLSSFWIRSSFKANLKNLSDNLINLKEYSFTLKLLEILTSKITELNEKEKSQCSYFFEILEGLLEKYIQIQNQLAIEEKIDYINLSLSLVEILTTQSAVLEESIFIGYVNILSVIIKNKETMFRTYIGCELKLIDTLIDKYLIHKLQPEDEEKISKEIALVDPNSQGLITLLNKPSYNTPDSRESIFSLLLNLIAENSQNILKLFSNKNFTNLTDFLSKLKFDKKSYNPSVEKRSSHGYCGLKNLSAICYMLSIIQQFFHMPILRYALIQSNDGKGPTYTDNNKLVDDNVLHQLQRMFVHMELTDRNEFWPTDFCYSFKGPDGKPTNVSQHQDTSEFLGKLFDILEFSLKNTEFQYLLQSIFLGKICSQLICKTCNNIRDNFEDFYSLSLEVKNLKTLNDSLVKFISEDHISDYFCDNCKKNVSVIKRASFCELPNVILMNLQRIQFNLDTLTNEKINSRLEFPKRINLKSFCTDSITKEENYKHETEYYDRIYPRDEAYYEYELVGVVVHMGTADWGHYYSTINVKRGGINDKMIYDPENEQDVKKWLTFNDSSVTSFLLKNMEEECFGGGGKNNDKKEKEEDNLWGIKKQKSNENENNKNAYVLVYERIKKNPLKMKLTSKLDEVDKSKVIVLDDDTKHKIMKSYDIFTTGDQNKTNNSEDNEIYSNPINVNTITEDEISLDCENTAVSRVDVNLTSSNKDIKNVIEKNNIYNSIFYDEGKKEFVYYLPFYSLTPKIPTNYFKEVFDDNLNFINDQKIFSKSFTEFLEMLTQNILKIVQQDNSANGLSHKINFEIFETIAKFVLEILPKSHFRDSIPKIVGNLIEIINLHQELSDIIINFIYINRDKLMNDILFSSDETSNSAYKNLIVKSILANFNLHFEELQTVLQIEDTNEISSVGRTVIKILDFFYSLIPSEASKSWTKICSFLELFEYLALSNHELILNYMFKKETIYRLIDFMLGKESPYFKKGETRTEMGNKTVPPKFAPLINTISELTRRCFTETWTEKNYIENPSESPQTFIKSNKIFNLSERDFKCVTHKNFYKKAIKDAYNNGALSKILAHFMYNNHSFSKKRVYMLLQSVNEATSSSEAKDIFDLLFNVITMYDKFSLLRLEWIFGIPQINVKTNGSDYPTLPERNSKYGEKIVKYLSPITYKTSLESLTEKIISKFQSSIEFINILNYLFALVLKKSHVFCYFDSIPHPRKDRLLYKDYLFDLANDEIARILNITNSGSKYESGIKGMTKIMEIYDEQRLKHREEVIKDLRLFSNKIPLAYSPNYKFGKIVREHITNIPIDYLNEMNVNVFRLEYDVLIFKEGLDLDIEVQTEKDIDKYKNSAREEKPKSPSSENKQPSEEDVVVEKETIPTEQKADKDNHGSDGESDKNSTKARNEDYDYLYDEVFERKNKKRNNKNETQQKYKSDMIENKPIDSSSGMMTSSKNNHNKALQDIYNDYNYKKEINEESFIKENLFNILNNETYTRDILNTSTCYSDRITVSAIRRFIIFNYSEKEFKIRCNFSTNDDFVNTYMPASEIIVCPKKNSISTIFTFTKEDIKMPWNEISVDVFIDEDDELENGDYEHVNPEGKVMKKSYSHDNLKNNEAPIRNN